jgi:MFS family permease
MFSLLSRYVDGLRYQDYRTLWTANACAGAAAWALIIARGWLAYDITGGLLWSGIVTMAAMIPRLFSTPLLGFLADKFDRAGLLKWTYTLNLLHNIALALLALAGVLDGTAGLWVLLVLSLINGTLRSAQMTITQSLIPNLLPPERLLNGIALNQATQQGSRLVGPLILVPLTMSFGIGTAFWMCSAFYLIGLIQVMRITTRSTGEIDRRRGFLQNLVAGFEYVYGRPQLLAMVMLVLAHCSFVMSYEAILPGISVEKLGSGAVGVSYLMAGVGGGALVASIFIAGVQSVTVRGFLFLLFGVTSALGPIIMAWTSVPILSILAAISMGVNQSGFMTISHAIIQGMTDDRVRGRVSGVYSMHVGGSMALTNGLSAKVADVFKEADFGVVAGGASVVMAVGGLIFIVVIVASLGVGPLRRLYFPRITAASPEPAITS